jgi:L-fucose isomerase-like protein
MRKVRAGFVGFGEVNTPRDIIEKKCREAQKSLEEAGIELVATQPVSDDPQGTQAERAINDLKKGEFDLLIICIAGWIPSWVVIKVAMEFSHKPLLLWGLKGYMHNGRLITTAAQAGTTAMRKVFEDMGFRYKYVYESPGAESRIGAVLSFARASMAASRLRQARVGMMGYRDMRLHSTLFDGTSLRARVGVEVECFEMLEMVQRAEKVKRADVDRIIEKIKGRWKFTKPVKSETLENVGRYFLALRDIVVERGYEAVSLIDVDGMKRLLNFPPAPINMLLGEELEICTIPENDSLGAVTQLMVKYVSDQIAPYFEFYELFEDRILVGVPDFVPSAIVAGDVLVMPAAFGKLSEGLLNISKVKTGRVTLSRLGASGDRYMMHVITGEATAPRPWEEAGWTQPAPQLPGLEIIPDVPVEDFARKVLSQHYTLAYGDYTRELSDLCQLLGIEILQ